MFWQYMQAMVSIKKPLFIGGSMMVALLFATIFFLAFDPRGQVQHTPTNAFKTPIRSTAISEEPTPGLPLRLRIPKINVDAAVEYVGLTPEGAMDVPSDPAMAAWYNLGPRPGEKGSAVIDGHFGWKNAQSAVFDDLHTLGKGDTVYIEDDQGAIVRFVVRESRTYNPNEDASLVFASTDGKSHLNLITCEGSWNKVAKSYSKRLVVFTDKE